MNGDLGNVDGMTMIDETGANAGPLLPDETAGTDVVVVAAVTVTQEEEILSATIAMEPADGMDDQLSHE